VPTIGAGGYANQQQSRFAQPFPGASREATPERHAGSPPLSASSSRKQLNAGSPPLSASSSRKQVNSPGSVRKLTIQHSSFTLQKELGKGSFGVVYAGTDDNSDEPVAIKDIKCRSEKELDQAKFEFDVMKKLQDKLATTSPRRAQSVNKLHCPKFFATQSIMLGPSQWKVLGAMERVTGEPLDGWEAKKKGTLAFDDSCTLAGIMLEQLVPTFDRVSEIAFHRDVNAHNILINVDNDDISTANFTLIDFGLAVDAREWINGKWKTHDIGGDCRYWPASAWMQFIYGYKYLEKMKSHSHHYIKMLDIYSLALNAIQLIVDTMDPNSAPAAAALGPAWARYWDHSTHFWKQVYAVFSKGGDWNRLKNDFMKIRAQETTEANVKKLRDLLNQFAKEPSLVQHRSLFTALAAMLELDAITWKEVQAKLREGSVAAMPEPVKRRGHMRNIHSTDGTGWMSQHAEPELGRLTRVPASVDDSRGRFDAAPAVPALLATAPSGDGKPHGVEVKKHSRIRSADFAQLNEARYRQAEAAALRKISEITEEDLSPVANMRYR
jgi:serine/threonine protein kinase